MTDKYAIVYSDFNTAITQALFQGARARLIERGIHESQVEVVKVPGAIEIPLIAQLFAQQKKYAAIICLGAVIRGETSHYDYVCQQVSQGCQKVMLDFNIPVIFGVLTTENEAQAQARCGGSDGHKGVEAADAALHMVEVIKRLR